MTLKLRAAGLCAALSGVLVLSAACGSSGSSSPQAGGGASGTSTSSASSTSAAGSSGAGGSSLSGSSAKAGTVCGGGSAAGSAASGGASSASSAAGGSAAAKIPASGGNGKQLTIGSANFAENQVLAYLYAAALDHAGFKTSVKELTTREVIVPALKSGRLDVEPDYAATLLEYIDGGAGLASPDVNDTVAKLRQQLQGCGLTALQPAPAIDTNGFAVTKSTAQKDNLSSLSDLKGHASNMVLGGAPECPQRPFCEPGLKKVYGLDFKQFKGIQLGQLMIQALQSGTVDVGEVLTTDPSVDANNLVLLKDDKHLQNADNVLPMVNSKSDSPVLDAALNAVDAKLTTDQLRKLDGDVQLSHKDPQQVAQQWLKDQGLIS